MKFGINCFGLNSALVCDRKGAFKKLKDMGFDYIEPNILFKSGLPMPSEDVYCGLKTKKMDGRFWCEHVFEDNYKIVKECGLNIVGCQISSILPVQGGVLAQVDDMIALGKKYGLKYFVYNPKKRGLKEGDALVKTLKTLSDKLNENGFELYIHNHSDEFIEENGTCLFDYLMTAIPDLKVELDVGWVKYAKLNVLSVMSKYRDRIRILHLKDIDDEKEGVFPAIGEGVIPLEDILKISKELNLIDCGIIFDQDDSANGILADTETGMANVKKYL